MNRRAGPRIGGFSAAERNKGPIFEALEQWLTDARSVLEIGAGDATHACYAVQRLPSVTWQTSEAPGHYRRLVAALADRDEQRLPAPIVLDVRAPWPARQYDAVYGANVAHIMDWAAVQALFAGAAAHLKPREYCSREQYSRGLLCLYGPFLEAGVTPAPSNAEFDAALRMADPARGLRELGALDAEATAHGLTRVADIAMPANNRLLIWRANSSAPEQ
jgi:hypothetical protein